MSDPFSLESMGLAIDGAVSRLVHGLTSRSLAPGEVRARAISKYREAREQTLVIVRDVTQAQADFSPGGNIWSVGQNVEHLVLTEQLYRTQMRNLIDLARKVGQHSGKRDVAVGFSEIDNSMAFIPRDVIPRLTVPLQVLNLFIPRAAREAMFRFPWVPALNPTASEPARTQPIGELRSRAVSSLSATEEIFRGKLPLNLMEMTLTHPALGTNNVAQILAILTAHEERHQLQIRSLLAHPRLPAGS